MTTQTSAQPTSTAPALAGKYLTFVLDHQSYGIEVLQVREIIRRTDITSVPRMPDYVRGVINLRGKIIPVIDLRLRFGMKAGETTEQACIIVVQVKPRSGKSLQTGLIVDGVEEVVNLTANEIEETPDFGMAVRTDYFLGLAKVKGVVKTLLNIGSVVAAEEIAGITAEN